MKSPERTSQPSRLALGSMLLLAVLTPGLALPSVIVQADVPHCAQAQPDPNSDRLEIPAPVRLSVEPKYRERDELFDGIGGTGR